MANTATALRVRKRVQDRYSGKLYRVKEIKGEKALLQSTDGGKQSVSLADIESDFRIV